MMNRIINFTDFFFNEAVKTRRCNLSSLLNTNFLNLRFSEEIKKFDKSNKFELMMMIEAYNRKLCQVSYLKSTTKRFKTRKYRHLANDPVINQKIT